MKKKAVALFVSFTMLTSACPVFASDFQWEGVVDKSQVQVGDLFNLDIDITNNPGIQNATIDISYDADVIVPVATVNAAEDILGYTDSFGNNVPLFADNYVDGIIARTDVENDNLRVANYTSSVDSEGNLIEVTGTGTLVRVTFKAVGSGNAELRLGSVAEVNRTPKKSEGNMAERISLPSVTVMGDSSENTEVTTADSNLKPNEVTETTTRRRPADSGNSNNNEVTTKETTSTTVTTEATTETTTVKTEISTETTTVVAPLESSFTDLASCPWAAEYINKLASENIVNGYNDNTFKPSNNVKRADFIIMLLKAMDIDTTKIPASNFSDIRSDKYYYNAVGIAKEMGIASGNNDGTFNPESNITRQDMMILAKKAVEMKTSNVLTGNTSSLDKFVDKASISPYATESLAAMVDAGVVSGSNGKIQPKDNTTRAQAAVIICKILDMMK